MLRMVLAVTLSLLAPSAAISGSAHTPEYVANIFWEFRKLVPDADAAEAYFVGNGFKIVSKSEAKDERYLEYADPSKTLFVILEQHLFPPIANNLYMSVSTYKTDREFVAQAVALLGKKLNRSDADTLNFPGDNNGWEDVGWVMADEDLPTVFISVAYNAEHRLTKIWSHQLRAGDE
ncbi:hypothetical protein C8N35_1011005 [Breoghania corrubedonensis]|uniref:Uncharacterized protein n=1 Tax=Breoghania corrubedonensis TaxID=665038 RepID=A0A2T5VGV3_9HYPH|nr:hypothetical protein [Breoghania corrubedonensis]PTW62956.1 hypothetical protein C8N35_1011005 [Breoghania corrubedonensis]